MKLVGTAPIYPSDPLWPPELTVEVWRDRFPTVALIIQEDPFGSDNFLSVGSLEMDSPIDFGPMLGEVFEVKQSELDETYRNRGLGTAMYVIAMQELGPLHPDWGGELGAGVSRDAFRVWRSLQRLPYIKYMPVENLGIRIKWLRKEMEYHLIKLLLPTGESTLVLWPDGWEGVLDQIYWFEGQLLFDTT